jgi:rfaE bifunctional protein kinase chain/domain
VNKEVNEIKKRAGITKHIVFVSGNFNIVHPGHLRLLRFAAECGDYLVVGVTEDHVKGVIISANLRLEGVRAIGIVDYAFIMKRPIEEVVRELRPSVIVKGKEHEKLINPEKEVIERQGGKLIFSSGETVFSSLELITNEFNDTGKNYAVLPKDFLERHQTNRSSLLDLIERFKTKRVCVLGDLIVDEYITCEPLGMSQEDPTIVVTPIDSTKFLGGAGIVAGHAAGLGANVRFVSISGNDPARKFALQELDVAGVDATIFIDTSRPTTVKQRYRSKGKSLLRVSHLHSGAVSIEIQKKILRKIKKIIKYIDLLIFSDFNYGCLPQDLVKSIIDLAKINNVVLAADSQSSSQVGDISRFQGMNLITPTEREARISIRNQEDGLVVLVEKIREQSNVDYVLLKLGEEGLLIHSNSTDGNVWLTDRIGALNKNPKDVAGAGDSLLTVSSLALCCGGTIWEAACLGSIAAAIQVGRIGNTPIKAKELIEELS